MAATLACFGFADDTLAERLRRRPAEPMGSPRVGSNPTGVVFLSKGNCVDVGLVSILIQLNKYIVAKKACVAATAQLAP